MILFKIGLSALTIMLTCNSCSKPTAEQAPLNDSIPSYSNLLEKTQRQTFEYFWQHGRRFSGMAPERSTTTSNSTVTTGGSGFGVMATICAMERNWIPRDSGIQRLLSIVRFLDQADRFHGAWSHWMDGTTGKATPFAGKGNGGDLVETSFMMAGLLTAKAYLKGNSAAETEIRTLIDKFWHTIEWNWFTNNKQTLHWSWYPTGNVFELGISGWNECLITYILALASPDYPIAPSVYQNGWTRNGAFRNGKTFYGYKQFLGTDKGGPLFLSHYSFLGLNPHLMQDQYTSYIQQNIHHTMINRAYCIQEAPATQQYSAVIWGLTASDGYKGYRAHSPTNDEGTIAPTAAIAAMPYTPWYAVQALQHYMDQLGFQLWGVYGFRDAFNLSRNWYDNQYLAIDQGPIIVMIENYRTGKIWDLLMSTPEVQLGLQKAGISLPVYATGFPEAVPDAVTGTYDMLLHPDRKKYEIMYYLAEGGVIPTFTLQEENGTIVKTIPAATGTGAQLLTFDSDKITIGKTYQLLMNTGSKNISISVTLH